MSCEQIAAILTQKDDDGGGIALQKGYIIYIWGLVGLYTAIQPPRPWIWFVLGLLGLEAI